MVGFWSIVFMYCCWNMEFLMANCKFVYLFIFLAGGYNYPNEIEIITFNQHPNKDKKRKFCQIQSTSFGKPVWKEIEKEVYLFNIPVENPLPDLCSSNCSM